ncbi:hypothetical protein QZH44_29875 (plasmid) [Pseudomonas corrugata]|uniref:hypothetical protein n=1 Tax=Pseudomonas corrugata TaxID=47879 RepID=UPI003D818F7C
MRFSRLGCFFSLLYILPSAVFVAMALTSQDSKSRYVLLQIPVALQMAALQAMGLVEELTAITWTQLYLMVCPPLIAALYGLGLGVGDLLHRWKRDQRNQQRKFL